jgi:hypothetical protein
MLAVAADGLRRLAGRLRHDGQDGSIFCPGARPEGSQAGWASGVTRSETIRDVPPACIVTPTRASAASMVLF